MVYELDVWSRDLNIVFTLKDYLFGAVKLAKNADPEKYSHSGCGIGFGCCSLFSIINSWGKNVNILSQYENIIEYH